MKISLSWIADHISIDKKELNVAYIAEQLAAITAEIDAVEFIRTDVSSLSAAVVTQLNEKEVTLECPELKKEDDTPIAKRRLSGAGIFSKDRGQRCGMGNASRCRIRKRRADTRRVDRGEGSEGCMEAYIRD